METSVNPTGGEDKPRQGLEVLARCRSWTSAARGQSYNPFLHEVVAGMTTHVAQRAGIVDADALARGRVRRPAHDAATPSWRSRRLLRFVRETAGLHAWRQAPSFRVRTALGPFHLKEPRFESHGRKRNRRAHHASREQSAATRSRAPRLLPRCSRLRRDGPGPDAGRAPRHARSTRTSRVLGHVTLAEATRAKHELTRILQMLIGLRRV